MSHSAPALSEQEQHVRDLLTNAYAIFLEKHAQFSSDHVKQASINAIRDNGLVGARGLIGELLADGLDFIVAPSDITASPQAAAYAQLLQVLALQPLSDTIKNTLRLIHLRNKNAARLIEQCTETLSITMNVHKMSERLYLKEQQSQPFLTIRQATCNTPKITLFLQLLLAECESLLLTYSRTFDPSKKAELDEFAKLLKTLCTKLDKIAAASETPDWLTHLTEIKSMVTYSPLFCSQSPMTKNQPTLNFSPYRITLFVNYLRQLMDMTFSAGSTNKTSVESRVEKLREELKTSAQKSVQMHCIESWIMYIEQGKLTTYEDLLFLIENTFADLDRLYQHRGAERMARVQGQAANAMTQAGTAIKSSAFFALTSLGMCAKGVAQYAGIAAAAVVGVVSEAAGEAEPVVRRLVGGGGL